MTCAVTRRNRRAVAGAWAVLLLCLVPTPGFAGERTVEFSGLTWSVRSGEGGPGPTRWSDDPGSVWVDKAGRLHLKVRKVGTVWQCAEVTTRASFGYGDYRFQIVGNVEAFDPNVVAGLFTYRDDTHEIDVEFSRWGVAGSPPAQYVVQPGSRPGNVKRFRLGLKGDESTHSFAWTEGSVLFESYRGLSDHPRPGQLIERWTCTSPDVPKAGGEKLHINLWLDRGRPPSDGAEVELVVASVTVKRR